MSGEDDWQVVSSDVTVAEGGALLSWVCLAWRRGFSSQSLSDPTADAFRFLLEALGLESSSSWRAVNKGHFKHKNNNMAFMMMSCCACGFTEALLDALSSSLLG